MTEHTPNLFIALELAAAGIAVFPVETSQEEDGSWNKEPILVRSWTAESTTDPDQIRAWWQRRPDAAPAIDLRKSGLFAIDADLHSRDVDGVRNFEDFLSKHGRKLPEVPVTRTPGKGFGEGLHFYLRQPAVGEPLGLSKGGLPKGVDVRGAGGYVVAPGSVRSDGARWVPSADAPSLIKTYPDIAEVPEWLVRIIRPPQSEPGPQGKSGNGLNSLALVNLDAWVPELFGPAAKRQSSSGGYRVSSKVLGRDLQEDLSIHSTGIVDFGIHDQGDARQGKRTPVGLVMEYSGKTFREATDWLAERLGMLSNAEEAAAAARAAEDADEDPALPEGVQEAVKRLAAMSEAMFIFNLGEEAKRAGVKESVVRRLVDARRKRITSAKTIAAKAAEQAEADKPHPLLALIQSRATLYNCDDIGYADVVVDGHTRTYEVKTEAFANWLRLDHLALTGGFPGAEAINAAVAMANALALAGPKKPVFIRIGHAGGKVYVDLCDDSWRVVEIDGGGSRVIDHSPVRFRRRAGMKPLPVPVAGSINGLRRFLNVRSDADFILIESWLVACFSEGPFPILDLDGQQGSAKTFSSRLLRELVDPSIADVASLPDKLDELVIAAHNSHVLVYDNLSRIPDAISDALCRLSTGGGNRKRSLYTNDDEWIFSGKRPIILNGIADVVEKPDLGERSIFVTLQPIERNRRRTEKRLWNAFHKEHATILGGVFSLVANGLKRAESVTLPELPRMADFAEWATACLEPEPWPTGTFLKVYDTNQEQAVATVLENNELAEVVARFMAGKPEWEGTSSERFLALTTEAGEKLAKSRNWPKTPKSMTDKLKVLATFLRQVGIDVLAAEPSGNSHKKRVMRMVNLKLTGKQPSAEPVATQMPTLKPKGVEPEAIRVPRGEDEIVPADLLGQRKADLDAAFDYYEAMFPGRSLRHRLDTTGWVFADSDQSATQPDEPWVGRTIHTDEQFDRFLEEVEHWWH